MLNHCLATTTACALAHRARVRGRRPWAWRKRTKFSYTPNRATRMGRELEGILRARPPRALYRVVHTHALALMPTAGAARAALVGLQWSWGEPLREEPTRQTVVADATLRDPPVQFGDTRHQAFYAARVDPYPHDPAQATPASSEAGLPVLALPRATIFACDAIHPLRAEQPRPLRLQNGYRRSGGVVPQRGAEVPERCQRRAAYFVWVPTIFVAVSLRTWQQRLLGLCLLCDRTGLRQAFRQPLSEKSDAQSTSCTHARAAPSKSCSIALTVLVFRVGNR